jgi:hypothetical protein
VPIITLALLKKIVFAVYSQARVAVFLAETDCGTKFKPFPLETRIFIGPTPLLVRELRLVVTEEIRQDVGTRLLWRFVRTEKQINAEKRKTIRKRNPVYSN